MQKKKIIFHVSATADISAWIGKAIGIYRYPVTALKHA